MPSRPKTIGVIGLGSIGMRHAKNLLAMGHKVWGYDPSDEKSKAIADLGGMQMADPIHDGGSGYNTIRLADAVIIASPTNTHAAYIEPCIRWKRPTFIEKPINHNLDIVDFSTYEKPIMVGNNLRFHSCVKKAKEWLNEGLIGKPLWASFCVAQHNTKYTDPVVLNWGAHEFDLALYLLGPATVTAATGNDKIFDTCLLHEYGVPSTIHCDYVTKQERRDFRIIGDIGEIYIDLKDRWGCLIIWNGPKGIPDANPFHGHGSFDQDYKEEMQAFIDLIDGKPMPHAATGEDGLHALELILEAQRMAEND